MGNKKGSTIVDESVSRLTTKEYEETLQGRLDRYVDSASPPEEIGVAIAAPPSPVFEELHDAWRQQLKSRMQFFDLQKQLWTGDVKNNQLSTVLESEPPDDMDMDDDGFTRLLSKP